MGFPDIFSCRRTPCRWCGARAARPRRHGQRLVDVMHIKHLHAKAIASLPQGSGWLIAEFGGDTEDEADARAQALIDGAEARP